MRNFFYKLKTLMANLAIDFMRNIDDKTYTAYLEYLNSLRENDSFYYKQLYDADRKFLKTLGKTAKTKLPKVSGEGPEVVKALGGFIE
jgi:hypothetical protein